MKNKKRVWPNNNPTFSRRIIGISPWPSAAREDDVNYYNKVGSKKATRMPLKEANKLIAREKRRKGFSWMAENSTTTNVDEWRTRRKNKFGDTERFRYIKTVTNIMFKGTRKK
tara:strand:- start:328 stop:666 length:339 start_codon:yes stop_codon:yes gene_type:complete